MSSGKPIDVPKPADAEDVPYHLRNVSQQLADKRRAINLAAAFLGKSSIPSDLVNMLLIENRGSLPILSRDLPLLTKYRTIFEGSIDKDEVDALMAYTPEILLNSLKIKNNAIIHDIRSHGLLGSIAGLPGKLFFAGDELSVNFETKSLQLGLVQDMIKDGLKPDTKEALMQLYSLKGVQIFFMNEATELMATLYALMFKVEVGTDGVFTTSQVAGQLSRLTEGQSCSANFNKVIELFYKRADAVRVDDVTVSVPREIRNLSLKNTQDVIVNLADRLVRAELPWVPLPKSEALFKIFERTGSDVMDRKPMLESDPASLKKRAGIADADLTLPHAIWGLFGNQTQNLIDRCYWKVLKHFPRVIRSAFVQWRWMVENGFKAVVVDKHEDLEAMVMIREVFGKLGKRDIARNLDGTEKESFTDYKKKAQDILAIYGLGLVSEHAYQPVTHSELESLTVPLLMHVHSSDIKTTRIRFKVKVAMVIKDPGLVAQLESGDKGWAPTIVNSVFEKAELCPWFPFPTILLTLSAPPEKTVVDPRITVAKVLTAMTWSGKCARIALTDAIVNVQCGTFPDRHALIMDISKDEVSNLVTAWRYLLAGKAREAVAAGYLDYIIPVGSAAVTDEILKMLDDVEVPMIGRSYNVKASKKLTDVPKRITPDIPTDRDGKEILLAPDPLEDIPTGDIRLSKTTIPAVSMNTPETRDVRSGKGKDGKKDPKKRPKPDAEKGQPPSVTEDKGKSPDTMEDEDEE